MPIDYLRVQRVSKTYFVLNNNPPKYILIISKTQIKRWTPMSKRPIGRPKIRWEDDVLEDIKSVNVSNWKNVLSKEYREIEESI
jgi:hypothetical protein